MEPKLLTTANDPSTWATALYAFLAEKERRSGSRRTVESYSRMLQDFFGRSGKTPDEVRSPAVLAWAHGKGRSGREPSSVTVGARIACLSSFFSGDRLAEFDCVIANPPFSLKKWGEDVWAADPYGRGFAGVPPSKSGDYAWVQHMIRSMAPVTGRTAVVLPHGALFRMGVEGKIRRKILESDLLEAVIGLGPNLFYGTGLAACILVFRQRKAAARKGKVLLIDGSKEFRKGRNQNSLEQEHVDRLFELYSDFANVPGLAHVAALEEVAGHDYNLNISLYVEPPAEEDLLTVEEALTNLKSALTEAYAADDRLRTLLVEAKILR